MDNATLWTVLPIVAGAVIFIIFFLKSRKRKKQEQERRESNPQYRAWLAMQKPPVVGRLGTKNFPEEGVMIDRARADLSDDALTHAFAECLCEYPNAPIGGRGFQHGEYEVCIFKSELTPGGNYAFKVPNYGYEGSPWDQGNFVYAAAMMVQIAGETYSIAVADQKERDSVHFNGVWFEAEHWLLAWLDGERFRATMVHGQGKGHPIMDGCKKFALKADAIAENSQPLTIDIPIGETGKTQQICVLAVT